MALAHELFIPGTLIFVTAVLLRCTRWYTGVRWLRFVDWPLAVIGTGMFCLWPSVSWSVAAFFGFALLVVLGPSLIFTGVVALVTRQSLAAVANRILDGREVPWT